MQMGGEEALVWKGGRTSSCSHGEVVATTKEVVASVVELVGIEAAVILAYNLKFS